MLFFIPNLYISKKLSLITNLNVNSPKNYATKSYQYHLIHIFQKKIKSKFQSVLSNEKITNNCWQ